jgi:hypothetical protein
MERDVETAPAERVRLAVDEDADRRKSCAASR